MSRGWLVPIAAAVVVGIGAGLALFFALSKKPQPAATAVVVVPDRRGCPRVYDDRLLTRQVYRAPDLEESVLACFYAAPGQKR